MARARDVRMTTPEREALWKERAEHQKAAHDREYRAMVRGSAPIRSTRLGKPGSDAHRDMVGFEPNQELLRFELALKKGKFRVAAKLAANLNEHMQRGGSPPGPWLGPKCMRTKKDVRARQQEAEAAEAAYGQRNAYV